MKADWNEVTKAQTKGVRCRVNTETGERMAMMVLWKRGEKAIKTPVRFELIKRVVYCTNDTKGNRKTRRRFLPYPYFRFPFFHHGFA